MYHSRARRAARILVVPFCPQTFREGQAVQHSRLSWLNRVASFPPFTRTRSSGFQFGWLLASVRRNRVPAQSASGHCGIVDDLVYGLDGGLRFGATPSSQRVWRCVHNYHQRYISTG